MKILSRNSIHDDFVWSVATRVVDNLLATTSADGTSKLFRFDSTGRLTFINNLPLTPGGQEDDDDSPSAADRIFSIRQAAFSSNGLLATASFDKAVRIYEIPVDTSDAKMVAFLDGHGSEVKDVCFDPDGDRIATCSRDRSVWVWRGPDAADAAEQLRSIPDGPDYEVEATLPGHLQDVKTVAFAPSGTLLVSGSYDNSIRTWIFDGEEWVTGSIVRPESIAAPEYGPARGVDAGEETADGQDTHTNTVWSVSFAPSALLKDLPAAGTAPALMASASADGTVRLWTADEASGELDHVGCSYRLLKTVDDGAQLAPAVFALAWRPAASPVEGLAETETALELLAAGAGGSVLRMVIAVASGTARVVAETVTPVTDTEINSLAVAGNLVFAGDDAGEVTVFDLE